jgi:hypothetical protein
MPDSSPGRGDVPPPSPTGTDGKIELPSAIKSTASGRVVVTLSSVAKVPPPLKVESSGVVAPPRQLPSISGDSPRKAIFKMDPEKKTEVVRAPHLNRTMEVKLPPKSGVLPKLTKLANMPLSPASFTPEPAAENPASSASEPRFNPPPLPLTTEHDTKAGAPRRVPAFKLKPVRLGASQPEESIFAEPAPKRAAPGWKQLEAGELPPPAADAFERAPAAKQDAVSDSPPPLSSPVKADALHVAPPLVNAPTGDHAENLRLPPSIKKEDDSATATGRLRRLAPPFPEGAVSKTISHPLPPPLSVVTPPPLPGIVSAFKKTGAVSDKSPPPVKEDVAAPVEVENFLLPAPTPLTQPELPIASARPAALPPALPKEPAEEKKTDAAPSLIETIPPVFTPSKKDVPVFDQKIQASQQVSEPPPPTKSRFAKTATPVVPIASAAVAGTPPDSTRKAPVSRAERLQKRRLISTITFYFLFLCVLMPALFFLGLHFSSETSVEGQVIPPPGTLLNNEVWIVSDFRELASGVADDLAAERAPKLQEIQERQDHVQRAQADIAAREERIRLLQEQIQAARDEIATVIKQSHDAAQKVWDGPGAALEDEYQTKLTQLQNAIADRAKSLKLTYTPDNTYQSPEVWANAYRLALYQTPPGVDGTKEHQWIEDQLTAWRAYTKSYDDRKDKLRQQAAQFQNAPSTHVTDVNGRIEDLQHRVDSTEAEEDPLKVELQQAQADLAAAQTAEADLDGKFYQQLYGLPEPNIIKRLPVEPNGRFSWSHLEKDSAFSSAEKNQSYWIFARAVRKDGLQYWVLTHFSIDQNTVLPILIEPSSFISTKAILRPDLPPDQQQ